MEVVAFATFFTDPLLMTNNLAMRSHIIIITIVQTSFGIFYNWLGKAVISYVQRYYETYAKCVWT